MLLTILICSHSVNAFYDDLFEGISFPIKRENGRFIGERIDINEQPLTNDHTVFL